MGFRLPCLYVYVSMFPCLHVFMSSCHVSISLCFHVSCLCLHVSMSASSCLHASKFPGFRKRIIILTESGNFRLLAENGKRKWQTSVCLLQTETENRSLFSLVGKRQTVIDVCCSANVPIYCRQLLHIDIEWASRADHLYYHLPFPAGVTQGIGTNKLLAEGFALPSVATVQGQATPVFLLFMPLSVKVRECSVRQQSCESS